MDTLLSLGFNRISMFLSVAHHGNLKDAAVELNVVPSTVSKNIAQLEKDLGVILFTRDKQSLSLTDSGQYLLQEWEGLTQQFKHTVEIARSMQEQQKSNLTIGLQNNLNHDKFFSALRTVREEDPGLSCTFFNDNAFSLIGKFNDHKLDLIVVCEKDLPMITDGNVRFKPISKGRLCVYLSKAHELYETLEGRTEVSLEEIREYSFVSIRHEGLPFYNDILSQISLDYDFPLEIVQTVENTEEMCDYLKLGAALMLAPSYIDVPGDEILSIPVEGLDKYSGPQIILWHQNSPQNYTIQKILQAMT